MTRVEIADRQTAIANVTRQANAPALVHSAPDATTIWWTRVVAIANVGYLTAALDVALLAGLRDPEFGVVGHVESVDAADEALR